MVRGDFAGAGQLLLLLLLRHITERCSSGKASSSSVSQSVGLSHCQISRTGGHASLTIAVLSLRARELSARFSLKRRIFCSEAFVFVSSWPAEFQHHSTINRAFEAVAEKAAAIFHCSFFFFFSSAILASAIVFLFFFVCCSTRSLASAAALTNCRHILACNEACKWEREMCQRANKLSPPRS